MITTAVIVGYFLVGLASARAFFSYSVRTDGYESSYDQETTHVVMALTVFFWPITGFILGAMGTGKLLRYRPPESYRDRMQRRRREETARKEEKRELERKIHSLEKDLGLHAKDECRTCDRERELMRTDYRAWRGDW